MMCANGTWNGGYVEEWGYTFPEVTSYGYYGDGSYDSGGNGSNIDSVLSVDVFSGYKNEDPAGCQRRCVEMLEYAGVSMSGNRIYMVSDSDGRAGDALSTAPDGINAINGALESGNPIIVGVDYKEGDYNGGFEDHFIVIVGRTVSSDGSVQYRYFDPRTGYASIGTSSNNILTLTTDGKLTGTFPDSSHNYTVTSVRTNK